MLLLAAWLFLIIGWTLLLTTSATLLLPNRSSFYDRLFHCCKPTSSSSTNSKTKLRILAHLIVHHLILLPIAAYLWTIDELLFSSYQLIQIKRPVITISVPRAGTTSLHCNLAKDPNLATPQTSEFVMPFICVNILLHQLHQRIPLVLAKVEQVLKYLNGVTSEVEARHPVSLFSPEADDVLLGEWHWVSVGSVRTFPVLENWWNNYDFSSFHMEERRRIMNFHSRICKKVLYLRSRSRSDLSGSDGDLRLLLRSHLSTCIDDFIEMYPDAIFVGILRDPIDVLRSFAGLSNAVVQGATGVQMLPQIMSGEGMEDTCMNKVKSRDENIPLQKKRHLNKFEMKTWPEGMQLILEDMMGREANLFNTCGSEFKNKTGVEVKGGISSGWIHFSSFKDDPVAAIQNLYATVGMQMSAEFKANLMQDAHIQEHTKYKAKHVYSNPTLEKMGVNEEQFLALPGVKLYKGLFEGTKTQTQH